MVFERNDPRLNYLVIVTK